MNNNTFNSIKDFIEYRHNLKLSSDLIFTEYLKAIYTNLLRRADAINTSKTISSSRKTQDLKINGNILSSFRKNSTKKIPQKPKKIDKGICLQSFLEYINLQELIGERIYKYLNKSKLIKLNKIEFITGLNKIYYGDIKDLIKFSFYLSDFNDDGKIYKSDMKLILAYIPSSSEYHQKLKIKQINKIINKFFEEKIENPKEGNEKGNEKEINFDDYSKYILEYEENNNNMKDNDLLNDYNNNAPFYYFISIISYIFQNCPFNVKSVNYFTQKKIKLTIMRNDKNSSVGKSFLTTAKKNEVSSNLDTITKMDISSNGLTSIKLDKKKFQKLPIAKINKINLFNTKRSLSQKEIIDERENEKYMNIINNKKKKAISKNKETIISKSNKKMNMFRISKEKNLFKQQLRKNKKITSFPDLSFKSTLLSSHANDYSYSPVLGLNKNGSNEESFSNSNNNLAVVKYNSSKVKLPTISKEKISPISVGFKTKEEDEEIDDFVLECDNEEDSNPNLESNLDNTNSNEVYLYKLCEDFNGEKTIMNKFYAKLCEKEILFFSPDLKQEFCDLWYIYRSHISLGKEYLNNQKYYTINITFFNNNYVNKLFFVNEILCQNFANKIKNSIHDLNFTDYYELQEKVGQGHFGTVNKCKKKSSGQIFAVKIINKNELKSADLELIRQEKNYLRLIMHPNIISLKDYYEDKKCIYLITELYKGGDLLTFIENYKKKNNRIPEKTTAKIIRKIAEGIRYLNFFGIVHRDIKPENILFSEENDIKSIKIIDLGVCQTLTYGEMAKEPIGTNGYISPEIYMHHYYSFNTDIWSLGVILYLLITEGLLPFDNENMDYEIIGKKVLFLKQEYPDIYFKDKNPELINLLDKMLEKIPNKRMEVNDLMKHSWFNIIKV